ncbi:MAG: phosphatase, partial [Actinomycetota bacterium]|nr:phosphatase [Actinomycetota bacterium]
MPDIDVAQIRDALIANGVTGPHQSHSRHNNISKIKALSEIADEGWFGITARKAYSSEEILGFLAVLTGCSTDIDCLEGVDTLDPDLTIQGLRAAAGRLSEEARKGSTLLAVTGHPTGLLELYI